MEVLAVDTTPVIEVPQDILLSNKTRLINIHQPATERIILPAESLQPSVLKVMASNSTTSIFDHDRSLPRSTKARLIWEKLRSGRTLNLGHSLVYDARWIYSGNIAHVIHDHLATLALIKHYTGIDHHQIKVLIEPRLPGFLRSILEIFSYDCVEKYGRVRAQFVSVKGTNLFQRLKYLKTLDQPDLPSDTPERIYLSRRKTRCVENEHQLLPILRELGFEAILMEDHPLLMQWGLLSNARQIVGIHGAGLSALAFKPAVDSSFSLVELFPSGFVSHCYRRYCAILGGRWIGCRGEITESVIAGLKKNHFDPTRLSVDSFQLHPDTLRIALAEFRQAPETIST